MARVLACVSIAVVGLAAAAAQAATDPNAAAREIEQQFHRGETAQAEARLARALVEQPNDTSLRFLKAVLLSETGHSAEASALFERLTQEFPDLPEPYNNLAVLQAAAGKLDVARELLETALRLDPGYRTAHENLGDVFVRLAQRAFEAAAGPRNGASPRIGSGLGNKLRLVRELAAAR